MILEILQAAFQITMVSVTNKAQVLGQSRMICGLKREAEKRQKVMCWMDVQSEGLWKTN